MEVGGVSAGSGVECGLSSAVGGRAGSAGPPARWPSWEASAPGKDSLTYLVWTTFRSTLPGASSTFETPRDFDERLAILADHDSTCADTSMHSHQDCSDQTCMSGTFEREAPVAQGRRSRNPVLSSSPPGSLPLLNALDLEDAWDSAPPIADATGFSLDEVASDCPT